MKPCLGERYLEKGEAPGLLLVGRAKMLLCVLASSGRSPLIISEKPEEGCEISHVILPLPSP